VLGGSRSNAEFVTTPSTNRGALNTPPFGATLSTTGGLLGDGGGSANNAWSDGGGSAGGKSPSPINEAAARVLTYPNESTPPNNKIDLNSVRMEVKQMACTVNTVKMV
jgi:hypothetical protein